MQPVIIIGGGVTGLTLALSLHAAGVPCRVYEAAPEFRRLGVGINLLPHGVRELSQLGLQPALAARGVQTREMAYYTRHGQHIYTEPRGRFAGYEWPQFSIHRGDFHQVLLDTAIERLGRDAVVMNHKCSSFEQDYTGITVRFVDWTSGKPIGLVRGEVAIGCDGIHSAVRKVLHPDDGGLKYQGINMWRGTSRWKPYLSGATMVQAVWLAVGKMVIYPITPKPDAGGMQEINWVAEIQSPRNAMQDWNLAGKLDDFLLPSRTGISRGSTSPTC